MGHFDFSSTIGCFWAIIEFLGVDGGRYRMCSMYTCTHTFLSIFEINEWFMGNYGFGEDLPFHQVVVLIFEFILLWCPSLPVIRQHGHKAVLEIGQ